VLAVVGALVLLPLTTVVVTPDAAEAAKPRVRYAKAAVAATNARRADHGLRRLHGQRCLQRMAVRQAERMARQRRMYHQNLRPVLRRCGLRGVGENVAYGFPTGRSVVNRGWMRSPGHRANILRPQWRMVVVAARKGGGRWYACQLFGVR